MEIPIVTVFTKIDLINEEQMIELIYSFKSMISKMKIKRVPLIMKNEEDIVLFSRNVKENIIPTFLVWSLKI
jgi:GTPase